jgi:anti-sigma factor RsiW
MNCRRFEMLIQKYHDGELGAAEGAEYENHLASCSSCMELDMQFAAVFGALDDIPLAEPSPGFDSGVMARVDMARYRKSAASRAGAAIRSGWDRVPFPARVTAGIAAVFGLFVAVYTPMIGMIYAAAGKAATMVGSGLYLARRVIEDPSAIGNYFATTTNYRLAGRILLETFEKQVSGIQLSHLVIAGLSAVVLVVLVVRATRVVWNKGETNVSII